MFCLERLWLHTKHVIFKPVGANLPAPLTKQCIRMHCIEVPSCIIYIPHNCMAPDLVGKLLHCPSLSDGWSMMRSLVVQEMPGRTSTSPLISAIPRMASLPFMTFMLVAFSKKRPVTESFPGKQDETGFRSQILSYLTEICIGCGCSACCCCGCGC